MTAVQLVADRAPHKDLIYGTNQTWEHPGDIKLVPDSVWPKMKAHADVYVEVAPELAPRGLTIPVMVKPKVEGDDTEGREDAKIKLPTAWSTDAINSVSDEAVRAEAKNRGYKIDGRLSGPNLRKAFLAKQ